MRRADLPAPIVTAAAASLLTLSEVSRYNSRLFQLIEESFRANNF
ncbi:MAG: hypothetical protein ABR577_01490 [Pyrinomonadaceae bacterium]